MVNENKNYGQDLFERDNIFITTEFDRDFLAPKATPLSVFQVGLQFAAMGAIIAGFIALVLVV